MALNRSGKGFLQFLVFLALASCLRSIEIPVEINGGRIVVSGQISTLQDQSFITLGITSDSTASVSRPLNGASIFLFEDNGKSFRYVETTWGTYTLIGAGGKVGHTYHIEIELSNGKRYKSTPEKMPEPSVLDSVSYEVVTEKVIDFEGVATSKAFYKIYANSTSITKNSYVKWNVTEDYLLTPTYFPPPPNVPPYPAPPNCYIAQRVDAQRISLFDWTKSSFNSLKKQLIATREVDWTFLEKHYFTTYQSTLTKDAYEYWRKGNILANQVGSIFDTPPAELTGNLVAISDPYEKVWGFFHAVNQTFQRKAFYESDLPFPLLLKRCDFTGSYIRSLYEPRCLDCITIRNSSYKRPSWF